MITTDLTATCWYEWNVLVRNSHIPFCHSTDVLCCMKCAVSGFRQWQQQRQSFSIACCTQCSKVCIWCTWCARLCQSIEAGKFHVFLWPVPLSEAFVTSLRPRNLVVFLLVLLDNPYSQFLPDAFSLYGFVCNFILPNLEGNWLIWFQWNFAGRATCSLVMHLRMLHCLTMHRNIQSKYYMPNSKVS